MKKVPLGEFSVSRGGSINPAKFENEFFDLYSIPSYKHRKPEVLQGREIGSSKKIVQAGDVLLSRIVPHIRRVWVVGENQGRRQIGSGEWIIYRGNSFAPNYLRHFLLSDPFHQQFMKTISGVGGSLMRARPSEVEKIKIPLPSLEEQKRIAAILDKADAIRKKRKQAIELTEQFLRSAFLDMFGDPITNPKGWPTAMMKDCIADISSGWSAKSEDKVKRPDEWGVLKISAVTSGRFSPSEYKVVSSIEPGKRLIVPKRGDLLFSRANTRDLVAATCLVEDDYEKLFLPDKLWRITVSSDMKVEYLRYLLAHPRYRSHLTKQATGTSGSMLNVSQQKLVGMKLPKPPLEIQKVFAALVWKTYQLQRVSSASKEKMAEHFHGLTQRAFRGDL